MPRSSILNGVVACYNQHILDPSKLKTVTFNAEVTIGVNDTGEDQHIHALLRYFIPQGEEELMDNCIYLVCGKIASITNDAPVGDGYNVADYDMEIEALMVRR